MMRAELLRVLAYLWAAFGAYWMLASQLKRSSRASGSSSRTPLRIAFLVLTLALLFAGRDKIPPLVFGALTLAWAAIALYWTASKNTSQSGEFRFYRPLRLVILALTFCLLFWRQTAVGLLGLRSLPDWKSIAIAGFLVTILGLAMAIWARVHLGRYWSDRVVLQENHKLIRSGPYAHMRHPIYSGVLLGVFGTAVVLGEVRGVIAFLLLLTNYVFKARREERILAQQFGAEFSVHQKHAGFLLPKFR
jgi:protein-S-isoprenylcysteine O-methyltransferase Ste14